ncbi:hypothetical protein OIV83_001986 [Microbotryomycetes sp. JL201]|nr:hypothetical protein OIV83_001986 [Microbotryomycetes sp. JL201]
MWVRVWVLGSDTSSTLTDSRIAECRTSEPTSHQPEVAPAGQDQAASEATHAPSQQEPALESAHDSGHAQAKQPSMMQKLLGHFQVMWGKLTKKQDMINKGETKLRGGAATTATTTTPLETAVGQRAGTDGHKMTRVQSVQAHQTLTEGQVPSPTA